MGSINLPLLQIIAKVICKIIAGTHAPPLGEPANEVRLRGALSVTAAPCHLSQRERVTVAEKERKLLALFVELTIGEESLFQKKSEEP